MILAVDNVPPGFELIENAVGYGASFGPVYVDFARAMIAFRVTENHLNPMRGCHGGAMSTFMDQQLLALANAAVHGAHHPTISLAVDFLAPVPEDAWVEAAVLLVRQTKTMLFTQAIATVDGAAVARSTAIYRVPRTASVEASASEDERLVDAPSH